MKTKGCDMAYPIEAKGYEPTFGLTKREQFAAMALQGLISDGHTMWDNQSLQGNPINIAQLSVEMADALINELNKEA